MRRATAALVTLAVVVAAAGCGDSGAMSMADYRQSISEVHDGVALDLGQAFEKLSTLSYEDYYDLMGLREVFDDAGAVFGNAEEQAGRLAPPGEARALHADLLAFYAEGREITGDLAGTAAFFEAVLPMLADVENLALPDLPEDAGIPEIKAATAEDIETTDGYVRNLDGMEPPGALGPLRERLVGFFRSLGDAIRGVDQAVTPEDRNAFLALRQGFPSHLETRNTLWGESQAYLSGMKPQVDGLIETGQGLATRIQQL